MEERAYAGQGTHTQPPASWTRACTHPHQSGGWSNDFSGRLLPPQPSCINIWWGDPGWCMHMNRTLLRYESLPWASCHHACRMSPSLHISNSTAVPHCGCTVAQTQKFSRYLIKSTRSDLVRCLQLRMTMLDWVRHHSLNYIMDGMHHFVMPSERRVRVITPCIMDSQCSAVHHKTSVQLITKQYIIALCGGPHGGLVNCSVCLAARSSPSSDPSQTQGLLTGDSKQPLGVCVRVRAPVSMDGSIKVRQTNENKVLETQSTYSGLLIVFIQKKPTSRCRYATVMTLLTVCW